MQLPRDRLHARILNVKSRTTESGPIARSGQVMIEYLIVSAILLACVAILAVLIYTLRENGHRVLELAGSEYP
jgi:hypothetical protein